MAAKTTPLRGKEPPFIRQGAAVVPPPNRRWIDLLPAGLLGLAVAVLVAFCAGNMYDQPANTCLGAALLGGLLGLAVCLPRGRRWPRVLLSVLGWGAYFWLRRQQLAQGVTQLTGLALQEVGGAAVAAPGAVQSGEQVVALSMLFGLVGFWLTLYTCWRPSVWPAVLYTAAVLGPGLFFSYGAPSAALALLFCALGGLVALSASRRRAKKSGVGAGRAPLLGLRALALLLLCTGLVAALAPERVYQSPRVLSLRDGVKARLESLLLVEEEERAGNQAVSQGRLGRLDQLKASGRVDMTVHLPVSRYPLYLRAYTGSVYTGDSWEALSSSQTRAARRQLEEAFGSDHPQDLPQKLVTLRYRLGQPLPGSALMGATVTNLRADPGYAYLPYYTQFPQRDPAGKKAEFDLDSSLVIRQENWDTPYTLYYATAPDILSQEQPEAPLVAVQGQNSEVDRFLEQEQAYRRFVYQTYTQLPKEGTEQIRTDFTPAWAQQFETRDELVEAVCSYLRMSYSYTRSPGRMPAGSDFVSWFLYENQRGYCAHFASAAAVIFRACGVPARYVSGYVVPASRQETGSDPDHTEQAQEIFDCTSGEIQKVRSTQQQVLDSSAHAWCEIYVDGFGWVPVDATPGYSTWRQGGFSRLPEALAGEALIQRLPQEMIPEKLQLQPPSENNSASSDDRPDQQQSQPDGATAAAGNSGHSSWVLPGWLRAVLTAVGGLLALAALYGACRWAVLFWRLGPTCRGPEAGRVRAVYELLLPALTAAGLYSGPHFDYQQYGRQLGEVFGEIEPDVWDAFWQVVLAAGFSQAAVSRADRVQVMATADRLLGLCLARMGRARRFWYRFMQCRPARLRRDHCRARGR
ncbi:transglutaminase domain-containing protein [Neobittarella massiliensis]|uniref:Transglutaminase domain-containing protein n=1 Tax=Neobittarella massiliensis (ex Bilen et al. 2018) TaxID=2041842 RepID=A0A8J6IRF7_9FIRM|nr:transglutaminase domain-containing protein [Neobittarella massiliensis]